MVIQNTNTLFISDKKHYKLAVKQLVNKKLQEIKWGKLKKQIIRSFIKTFCFFCVF